MVFFEGTEGGEVFLELSFAEVTRHIHRDVGGEEDGDDLSDIH